VLRRGRLETFWFHEGQTVFQNVRVLRGSNWLLVRSYSEERSIKNDNMDAVETALRGYCLHWSRNCSLDPSAEIRSVDALLDHLAQMLSDQKAFPPFFPFAHVDQEDDESQRLPV
jgi:hypothetical protein